MEFSWNYKTMAPKELFKSQIKENWNICFFLFAFVQFKSYYYFVNAQNSKFWTSNEKKKYVFHNKKKTQKKIRHAESVWIIIINAKLKMFQNWFSTLDTMRMNGSNKTKPKKIKIKNNNNNHTQWAGLWWECSEWDL